MRKRSKITFGIIGVIVLLLIIDIISIFIFNRPLIVIKKDSESLYKGIFYDTYNCGEFSIPQIKAKGTKFSCVNGDIPKDTFIKVVDNIKIELNIPNDWNYKEIPKNEENDFYKYALKLYKNDEEQYAMLYFYNNSIGFCGTGRTQENIILDNGQEAIIGYYAGDKAWSDISFYNINKNIAFMNCSLTNSDANEVIKFIKTIKIIENN